MATKIVQKDNPILRQIAKPVTKSEFGSAALQKLVADMAVALEKEEDGVAIAAPQIGASKRIFVISHRAFEIKSASKKPTDLVCINPELISMSKDKKLVPEGCLSVRWLYGNTRRASRAKMKAYDINGTEFVLAGNSLIAQIMQHEIDHLNGILFIDHAKDIHDLPPETIAKAD